MESVQLCAKRTKQVDVSKYWKNIERQLSPCDVMVHIMFVNIENFVAVFKAFYTIYSLYHLI